MIHFNFNIRNPYSQSFKNIKCWSGNTLFKNKFWELEIYKSPDILVLGIQITHRESHAGIRGEVGIFGYTIGYNFYDNRHWDTETNTWAKPQLGE
jgi:hypothetical protein